jgi:LPS-assembly lipoprotein
MTPRRAFLAGAILPATAVFLAGCGFALRRPPELPFSTMALAGFAPRSEVAAALRRELALVAVRVVESADAQVVLEALEDRRQRSVVATTAAAQVREVQLRQRLRFRVRTPAGTELLPVALIALSRDLSTSESQVLAKELEEAQLFESMTADIVQQLLRRLAAVRLP